VLVRPERNGYVYVLDRATGQVLSANPYAYITSSKGVDLNSGKLIYNEEKNPQAGKVIREICPAAPGAKDWQPSAFSPRTGLLYIPHQNLCMDVEGIEANYIAGTPYVGANVKMYAGPGGNRGEFLAWDPVKGEKVWAIQEKFPVWSGAVATRVMLFSTARWMVGLKLSMRKAGNRSGSSNVAPELLVNRLVIEVRTASSMWRYLLGWAAGRERLSPPASIRAIQPARLGFVNAMTDLPDATTKGGCFMCLPCHNDRATSLREQASHREGIRLRHSFALLLASFALVFLTSCTQRSVAPPVTAQQPAHVAVCSAFAPTRTTCLFPIRNWKALKINWRN